jgi:hypothetical protein
MPRYSNSFGNFCVSGGTQVVYVDVDGFSVDNLNICCSTPPPTPTPTSLPTKPSNFLTINFTRNNTSAKGYGTVSTTPIYSYISSTSSNSTTISVTNLQVINFDCKAIAPGIPNTKTVLQVEVSDGSGTIYSSTADSNGIITDLISNFTITTPITYLNITYSTQPI